MSRQRSPQQWDSLSPAYRTRLQRHVTREQYLAGEKLTAARRGESPEHPGDALKHPEKYRKYLHNHPDAERRDLIERASRKAVREFGDSFKFDNSLAEIKNNMSYAGINELREYMTLSGDEIRDRGNTQPPKRSMTWIHENWTGSIYWYHAG